MIATQPLSGLNNWGTVLDSGMDLSLKIPTRNTSPINVTPFKESTEIIKSGGILGDLYNRVQNMSPVVTQNTVSTTKQNPSDQLNDIIASLTDQFNQRAQSTASAYDSYAATFDDLLRSLADRYNTQGSAAATNAANTAIASGLTPAEAQSLSQEALLQVLQEYNPAQAQLASDQAQVGVAREGALAGLMQNLQLPFVEGVVSPYLQNVAGQVETGQQTTNDPMRQISALLDVARTMEASRQSSESDALGWAQLLQRGDLARQEMGMQGMQFGQRLAADEELAKLNQQSAMDRVMAQLNNALQLQSGSQTFESQQGEVNFDRDMEKLVEMWKLNNPNDTGESEAL